MPKAIPLTADDLAPRQAPRPKAASQPRGAAPSDDFIPLQFRLPRPFVKRFKQAALDRDMKLNEMLIYCFNEIMKSEH
jgi:hypothetical protein